MPHEPVRDISQSTHKNTELCGQSVVLDTWACHRSGAEASLPQGGTVESAGSRSPGANHYMVELKPACRYLEEGQRGGRRENWPQRPNSHHLPHK